ncbi:MAG: flippase-like domain-containing protein, partial [Blastocatellia bacterium]|nr:flippase-like domain-containing protein [Blastocatellia bacterium]
MSNQNTKKNRTRIIFAIKGLIGVGLIAYLFYKVGIKSVYESLTSADPKYLLTATGLVFLSHLFGVKRWQTISSALGIESTFRHFTMLHFLGLFCNYFLPAGIGGDVVKAYYLSKSEKQRRSSYLSVLLDRYIGLLALLIVASVVALVQFLGEVDKLTKNLSYFIWAIFLMFIVGGFV